MAIAQTVKLNFKSRVLKDESGNTIGRSKKQPSLEIAIPMLQADEIIAVLSESSKESELIVNAVAKLLVDCARDQFDEIIESFGDDTSKEVSADMLDYSKLNLTYLASIPPAQRGMTALTEEDWNTFFEDYINVMVAATGKELKRIKNHVALFQKPTKAKANKEVLQVLIDQLNIYMASSSNLDDTGTCAARIQGKFTKWISEPEKAVNFDML